MNGEGKRGRKWKEEVLAMSHRSRGGFTLVELLVVVVIIGMLIGLLMPAVIGAREKGRQAKCINNQKELGLAVLQYEVSKGRFPGYVNRFGANLNPLSWAMMVFADLGRADLWQEVRAGNMAAVENIRIEQLVCASDLEWENVPTRLSYVANCGLPGDDDGAAQGVFHDHFNVLPQSDQVRLSATDIRDGTAQTLMLSEHVSEATWTDQAEAQIGFTWEVAPDEDELNRWQIGNPDIFPNARPGVCASNHPGIVIVTFCDGHTHSLSDDINYTVYQHLMTPDSVRARSALLAAGVPDVNLTGVLDEGDY
jgi:prepilin-type N-terminal cleavage/methylation domain-containing protein